MISHSLLFSFSLLLRVYGNCEINRIQDYCKFHCPDYINPVPIFKSTPIFLFFLLLLLPPPTFTASSSVTSDIQLAFHLILAQLIDSHAGVFASIEGAWLTNIEGQHSLVILHQEFRIITDDHSVLHPDNLRLGHRKVERKCNRLIRVPLNVLWIPLHRLFYNLPFFTLGVPLTAQLMAVL